MIGFQKTRRYRNRRILDHARHIEQCQFCFRHAPLGIVAAHSNQSRHGKGASLKAHDCFVAYLCMTCHDAVDAARVDNDVATYIWTEGHVRSVPLFLHLLTADGLRLLDQHS